MSLLPATGPMWAPARPSVHPSGPTRCGCDPIDGGCDSCQGDAAAEWEMAKADRAREAARERSMRTDPAFRASWLEQCPPEIRERMAAHADRKFGVLPAVTEQGRGAA